MENVKIANSKSSKVAVAAEGTKVAVAVEVAKMAVEWTPTATDKAILNALAEGAGVKFDELLIKGATSLEAAKTLIKGKAASLRPAKSFAVSHKLGYKVGKFIWEQKRFPNEVEAGKLGMSSQAYNKKASNGNYYREIFLGMVAGGMPATSENVSTTTNDYERILQS